MAIKRSTNKRAIREAASAALTPDAPKPPVSNPRADRDAKIADRVKRDQAKKRERQAGLDARAAASHKPAPKKAPTTGFSLTGTGGLTIEAGSPEAIALAKAIKSSPVKTALKTANDVKKAGTKNATAAQRRKQTELDTQGKSFKDQAKETRRRQTLGMETDTPPLSPGDRRKHELIIAKAVRTHGHLNHPDVQPSVTALGVGHAGYIASKALGE